MYIHLLLALLCSESSSPVHVHTNKHIYIHKFSWCSDWQAPVHMCVCTFVRAHVWVHVCVCARVCVCAWRCVSMCRQMCVCGVCSVWTCVCVCICVCACVCLHACTSWATSAYSHLMLCRWEMLWCSSQTMRTKARHDSCRPYNRPTTGQREFVSTGPCRYSNYAYADVANTDVFS